MAMTGGTREEIWNEVWRELEQGERDVLWPLISNGSATSIFRKISQLGYAAGQRTGAEEFYEEVCRRAEANMLKTGKLEGAHYAAMKQLISERALPSPPERKP